jgi:hypothetical protein
MFGGKDDAVLDAGTVPCAIDGEVERQTVAASLLVDDGTDLPSPGIGEEGNKRVR